MKNKKLFAILTLVCFMFTLMPVAAFAAAPIADSMSVVYAEETDVNTKTNVDFGLSIRDVEGTLVKSTTNAFVWVTREGSTVPVNTVKVNDEAAGEYVYELDAVTTGEKQFTVSFNGAGTYQVHVSSVEPEIESGKISTATEFTAVGAVVTATSAYNPSVESLALNVTLENSFKVAVDGDRTENDVVATADANKEKFTAELKDGDVAYSLNIAANNVDEKKVVIELTDSLAGPQAGKVLEIETAGAIDASKDSVTTNALGKAEFTVSGNAEGTYKVYVTYGQFEVVIEVVVGATAANTIACVDEPTNPIDILNTSLVGGLGEYVEFEMYDVNGNKLATSNTEGWTKAAASATNKADYNYVSIVEQPAASKLENKNVWFNGTTICLNKNITVEGTYTFKVVLNNGNYATATIEVKEFTTPVKLVVEYPEAIELGSAVGFTDLYWLDVNNVEKAAYSTNDEGEVTSVKVDLAATGYAVRSFDAQDGALAAKSDEKYVGAEITITAVDERYNLIATTVVTVADEAKELAFSDKTAEVKVNNKIEVSVVDSQGKTVTLGTNDVQNAVTEISYVILDKPADAKVFVSTVDNDLLTDGTFEMNLTSNVVGNVAVQALVKYSYTDALTNANVVKYYTGTQIFAVGTAGVGDVVVMSIGSNEIIINDAKAAIDAAPIVENNRTFVPFRALAEAFGATVAYDEATQAVTAELNGVTVVMTIGSAEYTVNGEAKTADVAPFINGSRTMVPVRFAAEAFGIKVIPTYDENGATADILFNL